MHVVLTAFLQTKTTNEFSEANCCYDAPNANAYCVHAVCEHCLIIVDKNKDGTRTFSPGIKHYIARVVC